MKPLDFTKDVKQFGTLTRANRIQRNTFFQLSQIEDLLQKIIFEH